MTGSKPREREALAQAVQELREEQNLSLDALAGLAGLSRPVLKAIEAGEPHAANSEELVRLARALRLPLSAVADRYEASLTRLQDA